MMKLKYLYIYVIILLVIILIIRLSLNINSYINKDGDNFSNIWQMPKSFDDIDAIIYINLENREDRKKLILDVLKSLDIPESKIHKISGIYIPKNGHKGCVQSHILALNMAKMNKWHNVLILEDDAELNEGISPQNFKENIKNMFEYLNGKYIANNDDVYDIIMLATMFETKASINNEDDKLKEKYGNIPKKVVFSTTSSAYIVNSNYIEKMIKLFEYLNYMMLSDKWTSNGHENYSLDQNWNNMQKDDKWYCWDKDLMKQRGISSTINADTGY